MDEWMRHSMTIRGIYIQRLLCYLYPTGFSFIFKDCPIYIQQQTTLIQRPIFSPNFYSTLVQFHSTSCGEVCKFVKMDDDAKRQSSQLDHFYTNKNVA